MSEAAGVLHRRGMAGLRPSSCPAGAKVLELEFVGDSNDDEDVLTSW